MAHLSTENDEITPPPLKFTRTCSADGCGRKARTSGRYCNSCHAAAVRRYKARKGANLRAQRRHEASLRSEEDRAADSARAKLAVYIRRGKIARGYCVECVSADVTAIIADPRDWRNPVWACADHRSAVIHGIEDRARSRRNVDEWITRRTQALAAFEQLPPDVQAAIRERASQGPVFRLSPEAPLYVQRLVSEVERLSR